MPENAHIRDIDALRDLLPPLEDCPGCEERLKKIAARRAERLAAETAADTSETK